MDFTLTIYERLLQSLLQAQYHFSTFAEYQQGARQERQIILRHDVDLKPGNSLKTAEVEHALGIKSSYFFRAVPQSWDEAIIKQISAMGHEVGYHYESLTTCNGDVDKAYQDFCQNLERLRQLVDVKTICMHGSPRSPYDSKDIWKKYDYKSLDIIGEPYLDIDFSQLFYLTDTGRRWDGYKVSVRDKIEKYQDIWTADGLTFHSTEDIINAAKNGKLPARIMITTHPQRWNDSFAKWCKELIVQNLKNIVKRIIVKTKQATPD